MAAKRLTSGIRQPMSTRTVALIQARMSSSRLPGKVLEPLQGMPLIVYMARRAARARLLDELRIVTSTDASDDALADAVSAAGLPVFRGSLDDVLDRYAAAAAASNAGEIVRLTGDCPLIDPDVIDAVVAARRSAGTDYASNIAPPTFPDGMDVECFSRATLERAHAQATRGPEREHVTLWMRRDDVGLRHANHTGLIDASALRLTVDYADDLALVRRLLQRLPADGLFDLFDILRVLSAEAGLRTLNMHERNEGLAKSLAEERKAYP
jgi:spore coat polysaccharide biosynthesis protein SpsF (cytidylyltransferase family)